MDQPKKQSKVQFPNMLTYAPIGQTWAHSEEREKIERARIMKLWGY